MSDCEYADLLETNNTADLDKIFLRFLYLAHDSIVEFMPEKNVFGYHSHDIIEIEYAEVLDIVDAHVPRIDTSSIQNDVRRRQIERFK